MAEKDVKLLGGGTNPVGTILTFFGDTAPDGYLTCDGTEYNKSDYPELSGHLLSLTNNTAYIVSGDDTKFKVPDLRGEFLRGAGENSHENSGNGENVGVHQGGTIHPAVSSSYPSYNQAELSAYSFSWNNQGTNQPNLDYTLPKKDRILLLQGTNFVNSNVAHCDFISRPTNTSVLYCIKT